VETLKIEPVPARGRDRALGVLLGGAEALAFARKEAFEALLNSTRHGTARLWWARRARQCVGALLLIKTAGKVGLLMLPDDRSAQVDPEATAELVRQVARQSIQEGLAIVQALVDSETSRATAILLKAGLDRLTELLYLRRRLDAAPPPIVLEDLTWRPYEQRDEDMLAELIGMTYRESLDCPAIARARTPADAIDSHKTSGRFRPDWWWLAFRRGEPAGCVLVNEANTCRAADVVYMGVVPSHRRKGLGRAMLRRAQRTAFQEGFRDVTLAVDAQNEAARRLYETEGFQRTAAKLAFVMLRKPPCETAEKSNC